jgi:hypothetical protein
MITMKTNFGDEVRSNRGSWLALTHTGRNDREEALVAGGFVWFILDSGVV